MEYAASVYNHYASKAGIAQALAERALAAHATARFLLASWAAVLTMEARPDAPEDPAATLSAGIRAMIQGNATPATVTRTGNLRARYEDALERHGFIRRDS